jgi:hypothetical protein
MSEPLTFKLTGNGAFAVDHKAMPDTSKLDPATFAKDQKAIFDLIAKVIPAISGDLHFTLDIPAGLAKETGSKDIPKNITLSLKLVDSVIYVNVSELAEAFPQLKGAKGWMGINLVDVISAVAKEPSFTMFGANMGNGAAMGSNMSGIFADPKTMGKFLKIERLADGEVDSHKVAVFKTTLDYAAMFDMPEMQDFMKQQMAATGSKMSDKDLAAAMLMVRGLARDMEFTVTQNIGLEDKYVYQTDMNMKFDFSSMKAQMGSAIVLTMSATVTQSDFNAVETIAAPEGALVLPVESVIPSKK